MSAGGCRCWGNNRGRWALGTWRPRVGSLTIHTRQLDMIMLNEADVQYYAEKFIQDLEKLAVVRGSD